MWLSRDGPPAGRVERRREHDLVEVSEAKSVLGSRLGPLRSDGTTAATRKSCPQTKTRSPPGAGSGRRSLVLGVGACEGRAEPLELLRRQCLLDHREEDALLVADVALEALAKLPQLRRIRVRASL
jgi:hypothetical protein